MKNPFSAQWLAERRETLSKDLLAGAIVGFVALPLSIGYAVASGVPPMLGVWASVIAGFIAAIVGGSEYQVSGPTGALVVVTLATVTAHGLEGLILTVLLSGLILFLMGALRLGKIIEYIPGPVTIGITAGIGALIFLGQIPNILGVTIDPTDGVRTLGKAILAILAIPTADLATIVLAFITIGILIIAPRLNRTIPWSVVAIAIATTLVFFVPWFASARTVSDLSPILSTFPLPSFPDISWDLVSAILPAALTLAVLIAIESLLTAVHTDAMTGTRHQPNRELIGQGFGNMAGALFGCMPSAGTAARTALNVRLGARSRVAAVVNTIVLCLVVFIGSGAIARIPLAAIGGLLAFVAFNMIDWERIRNILRTPLSDIAVMVTTFGITISLGVTPALEVGLILAALLFMKRMSDLYNIDTGAPVTTGSDTVVRGFQHPDISIYTVQGPLFFGAAIRFDQQVTAARDTKPLRIIRMKLVPVIDATGLEFLERTSVQIKKRGGALMLSAVHPDVMRIIRNAGIDKKIGVDRFFPSTKTAIAAALRLAHERKGEPPLVTDEEMARYDLTGYDLEESSLSATRDKDPIEDILETTGIRYLTDFGQKTIEKTLDLGHGAFFTTVEAGKTAVTRTADATTKMFDATTRPLRKRKK